MNFPIITAEEAAEFIHNGDNLGFSGFTYSGIPKVVPGAIAAKARREHEAGREFKVSIFTGASTSDGVDGELSRAQAINRRTPYQNTPELRKHINNHEVHYFDLHLSELAQKFRYGTFGKMHCAIIEATSITDDGKIVLGTGVGNVPTWAALADKIIIELNEQLDPRMEGMHDLYMPLDPPHRREIPLYTPYDRIGTTLLQVDPKKVVGVVKTNMPVGTASGFTPANEVTNKIGENVCSFLINEIRNGRIPKEFLPIQSGVGNVANAVLAGLEASDEIPPFAMYTEVMQDTVLDLVKSGKCKLVSTCSMSFSNDAILNFYKDIDSLRNHIILRPAEISNNPGLIRRLGVIAMNTALEADIFGNINSTHVTGTKMMNGIGGSGDFTRNGYLSIFSCPSVAKDGLISAIVPMCSHIDHTEHSVDVIITEQGVADIRGLDPVQRAETIIENCAHPIYRPLLREYLRIGVEGRGGQTAATLEAALAFHTTFLATGNMQETDFAKYIK